MIFSPEKLRNFVGVVHLGLLWGANKYMKKWWGERGGWPKIAFSNMVKNQIVFFQKSIRMELFLNCLDIIKIGLFKILCSES